MDNCVDNNVYEFNISLAGIPIHITCENVENKLFFRDYMTEDTPLFSVHADKSKYDVMQSVIERTDIKEGRKPCDHPDYVLENMLLHKEIADNLLDHNILLFHGSAICMDDKAYLFTAKSGTGKSTHAKLWRNLFGDRVQMINDDKPLIRIENDAVTVFGSPWDGKHHLSRNTSAELDAIIWLNRSETNHIYPMMKADAFPVVLSQAYSSADPLKMQKILALEKQLIYKVKFYKLFCNMEADAPQTAYDGLMTL